MGFSPESYTFMTMGRLLTAEENKVEQATGAFKGDYRSLHIHHNKYSIWALDLTAIRL
jgi:hypothetical protein